MKKVFLLVSIFIVAVAVAQEDEQDEYRTVFSGKDLKVSGFGGPLMTFSTIGNDFAHMMGGGGGVIFNNFFFGGYGMGLTTEIDYPGYDNYLLDYGHGGLWFGFILGSKRAIHPSFHVKAGWGSITRQDVDIVHTGGTIDYYDNDDIFVTIPTLELEANVSRFFRIGAGASYTIVNGMETITHPTTNVKLLSKDDFRNPSVYLSFKFGWFH